MKALHSKDFKIADGDLVIVPRLTFTARLAKSVELEKAVIKKPPI